MFSKNKIKKILLIHPPGNRVVKADGERGLKAAVPPLGLAYLASALQIKGYEVVILDCIAEGYNDPELELEPEIYRYGLGDGKIAAFIKDIDPDIVGISCPQTVRQLEANNVALISKKALPDVPVVMGGASPSALRESLMSHDSIDFIVQGEGEERFCHLLDALQNHNDDLKKVDGLIYRSGKSVIVNRLSNIIRKIDLISMPAYDLLPMDKYSKIRKNPAISSESTNSTIMISSRGCAMKCYYCPVHNVFGTAGPSFRMRAIENVLMEIELLVSRYGIEEIQFEDANFNASPARTIALSEAIAKRFPDLKWCSPHGNQLSTLNDEVLEAMREGGCHSLYLAIESGNQAFLDNRKKSVRLDNLDHVLKSSRELGFKVNSFFMIGYPEEKKADIQNTISYAKSLDIDDAHFFIATPFPGTDMYDICKKDGLIDVDLSWRHFRYSLGVISTEYFDPAYLQKVRRDAWLEMFVKKAGIEKQMSTGSMELDIYG